jgi:hypothetical protein
MSELNYGIEIGTVYTFKFNSGEEMIGKVAALLPQSWFAVEEPLSVAPNAKGMGLIPSLFTSDPAQPVKINMNSLAMYCEAEDSIKMKYLEATTGIKVPEKKILVG